ncbi:hypothetical protein UY3_04059 [Chelonia mydas]|uniref:Coiled-coil domain-containing protein 148 n=1 Tax=Chelonia mydas TaxID=8469 RepID=M7BSK3_CHEMY|nr:hypothetical protein UY3_04059 [Chelonia mydas]
MENMPLLQGAAHHPLQQPHHQEPHGYFKETGGSSRQSRRPPLPPEDKVVVKEVKLEEDVGQAGDRVSRAMMSQDLSLTLEGSSQSQQSGSAVPEAGERSSDNLVVRMKNGLFSQKYKPVDYKQLHALTEEKKKASANIQLKRGKLQVSAELISRGDHAELISSVDHDGVPESQKSSSMDRTGDSSQQASGETGFPDSQELFLTQYPPNPPKAASWTQQAEKGPPVKKVEQASKTNKEQMLLKLHHQIWWQEHKRLSENRHNVEAEIQTFLDEGSLECELLLDMSDLAHKLSKELDTYQTNTVDPIWQLREDLKCRLSEMQCYPSQKSCMEYEFIPVKVLEQVDFVKKQQKTILELLNQEKLALEQELEDCKNKVLIYSFEEKTGLFHEVPTQLLALECPYPDLKSSVLNEFHKFADEYWSKLQEIDQQLNVISRNFGWSEDDHWVYQTVINQYPSDLQSRRTLYLDMLQRHLPHKSRHDLVAHEKAWDQYHFARNQRRALILNWAQARKAFLLKAVMTIAEACAAHETEVMLANNRRKQQEICADLKGKWPNGGSDAQAKCSVSAPAESSPMLQEFSAGQIWHLSNCDEVPRVQPGLWDC